MPLKNTTSVLSRGAECPFEVAWLAHHGRIELPKDEDAWFEKALGGSGIALLPITPAIARTAVQLPEHHRDPQDRLIIATALAYQATLISVDEKFPLYSELAGALLALQDFMGNHKSF
ncbi:hypothetical protein CKO23_25415 [Thiocystis violacea]|nr:hypothetical protein [Thiocystis violacea]